MQFAGTDEALYERHLLFDSGVAIEAATARDRFEALARSVRDILSQRWLLTEKTYEQQNPKRLYYLGQVLKRPYHRRIRRRNLERATMSSSREGVRKKSVPRRAASSEDRLADSTATAVWTPRWQWRPRKLEVAQFRTARRQCLALQSDGRILATVANLLGKRASS